MTATERRLYDHAVAQARMRDRLYFGSDRNAAAALGVSTRTIIRCRQSLERQGWLKREGWHHWPGGKKTVRYCFPRRRVTQRTSCRTPKGCRTPSLRSGVLLAHGRKRMGSSPRPRDLIWDEMEAIFGRVTYPANSHGRRNKAVADLKRLGATPEGIRYAHREYLRSWPNARCTDIALATHYPLLALNFHRRTPPCPECGIGGGRHLEDCSRALPEA